MKSSIHTSILAAALCLLNIGLYGQSSGPIAEGERELGRERYDQARTLLNQIPGDATACYLLGELYLSIQKTDSAALNFQKGLNIDKEQWGCLIGLGQTLLANSPAEAEKLFDQAVAIRKYRENAQVQDRIAIAYLSMPSPNYEKVRLWLNNALAVNASEPLTYIVGGDMYVRQKKGNDAVNSYKTALELDPDNTEALYKLAKVYYQGRLYDWAIEQLNRVIALDSLHLPSYRLAGEINYRKGLYSLAIDSYRQLIKTGASSMDDRARYATSLFFDKRYEEALPEFEKILQTNPNNPTALRLNAYAQQYKGEYEQGISTIQKFFSVGNPDIFLDTDYQYYGRLLMGVGKDSLAYVNFAKAIGMADPENKPRLYQELLDSLDKRKAYELADAYYQNYVAEGGYLKPVQCNSWTQDCYFSAVNRLAKGTAQDSALCVVYAQRADSLAGVLTGMAPQSYLGLYWQANAKALLDLKFEKMDAKPLYEKLLEYENLPSKPKTTAFKYLGACYVLNDDLEAGLVWYKKYLEINPNDLEISRYVTDIEAHLKEQMKQSSN